MIFEDFRGIKEARTPRGSRPGAEAEQLRLAYLDLLKLSLCDLGGSSSVSVGKAEDGTAFSRELLGDELRLRAAGMDWPLQGLTMIGLNRLDDLQRCVESVALDQVSGDLIEAGAWRGGASILMRAVLDSLGERERTVWVADSFQGFPVREHEREALSASDFLSASLEEVKSNFARFGLEHGVRYLAGFFEQTLPGLRGHKWSIVRLDADTYEATWLALCTLYPGLAEGGYLIVDDYRGVPECREAIDEFRHRNDIEEPLEDVDWTCVRWRRQSTAPLSVSVPTVDGSERPPRPVSRPSHSRVPSARELELERELVELRAQLASARRGPLAVLRRWLAPRLKRRVR